MFCVIIKYIFTRYIKTQITKLPKAVRLLYDSIDCFYLFKYNEIVNALAVNPLTLDPSTNIKVIDELIEAHKEFLPDYK